MIAFYANKINYHFIAIIFYYFIIGGIYYTPQKETNII